MRIYLPYVVAALALLGGLLAGRGWMQSGRDREGHDRPATLGTPERASGPTQRSEPRSSGEGAMQRLAALRSELSGEARKAAIQAMLLDLAELDPAKATELALELTDDEGRAEAVHECLPLWLAADPEGARAALLTRIGSLPPEVAQAIARDAAAVDPSLAMALARQIYVGTRAQAMRDVFSAWAARDPVQAAAAVEEISKPDGYVAAVEEIGRVWVQDDARSAHAWATELRDAEARRAALVPIVSTWAAREPAAAAQAAATLARDPFRPVLIDRAVQEWARVDPERALAWVQSLGEPGEREASATTVLTQLLESEPASAAQWAVRLGGGVESPLADKVLTAWLARDRQAADRWMRAHEPLRVTP